MSKSVVKLGKDQKIGLYGEADVWGSDGAEQVILNKGATGVSIQGGVESIDMAMNFDDYQFATYGGNLYITQGGKPIGTVAIGDAGATIAFLEGSVQVTKGENGSLLIGEQEIVVGADAAELDPDQIKLDTENKSEAGKEDPVQYKLSEAVAKLAAGEDLAAVYTLTEDTPTIAVDEYKYITEAVDGAKNAANINLVTYNVEDTTAGIVDGSFSVVNGATSKYVIDTIENYIAGKEKLPTTFKFDGVELSGSAEADIIQLRDGKPASGTAFDGASNYFALNDKAVTKIAGGNGYDWIQMTNTSEGFGENMVFFAGAESEQKLGVYEESVDASGAQAGSSIAKWFENKNATDDTQSQVANGNVMDWFGDKSLTLVCSNVKDTILMQAPNDSETDIAASTIKVHSFTVGEDSLMYFDAKTGWSTADLNEAQIKALNEIGDDKVSAVEVNTGMVAVTVSLSDLYASKDTETAAPSYFDTALTIELYGVQGFEAGVTTIADLFGVSA